MEDRAGRDFHLQDISPPFSPEGKHFAAFSLTPHAPLAHAPTKSYTQTAIPIGVRAGSRSPILTSTSVHTPAYPWYLNTTNNHRFHVPVTLFFSSCLFSSFVRVDKTGPREKKRARGEGGLYLVCRSHSCPIVASVVCPNRNLNQNMFRRTQLAALIRRARHRAIEPSRCHLVVSEDQIARTRKKERGRGKQREQRR